MIDDVQLAKAKLSWNELVNNIESGLQCLHSGDYVQPVKPYLRFGDLKNRIIAMPAYVGGSFQVAGIKWISSFPDNVQRGLPRAHSIVILNDVNTGEPISIITTPEISIKRTAAVSGLMLRHYVRHRKKQKYNVGIIGWGPIGQAHMSMCRELLGHLLGNVFVYDKRKSNGVNGVQDVQFTNSWQQVYDNSDIFITCTSSTRRYIDEPPAGGKLLLHVSLRDYKPEALKGVKQIVIDDWQEVCRENTDIELLHLQQGLSEHDCMTFSDLICNDRFRELHLDEPLLFSPMGMAVFDLCTAALYDRTLNHRK